MSETVIQATENGPLKVDGPVTLIDAAGDQYRIDEEGSNFLCRCGKSGNKPFCDGTHAEQGFDAPERALPEADAAR